MRYIPIKCIFVLNRLPDVDKNIEATTVQNNVSQAVVLKRLRRVNGEDEERSKRKKKKITVESGKSFSLGDFWTICKVVPLPSS